MTKLYEEIEVTRVSKRLNDALLVAGDFALSAGFGTTASVAVTAGSTDERGRITVTSSGTGQGANPTVTLTFKKKFDVAPVAAMACRGGGSQRTVPVEVVSQSVTTLVIALLGTPVAAETYQILWSLDP